MPLYHLHTSIFLLWASKHEKEIAIIFEQLRQKMFRLPPEFLKTLEAKYKVRRRPSNVYGRPYRFSIPNLVISLEYFVSDSLASLDRQLCDHYSSRVSYKGYSKDNIYRIVGSNDPGWKPAKEFVELLCYYAFDRSYEGAVKASLLPDELTSFRRLKSQLNGTRGSLNNALGQPLVTAVDFISRHREIEQEILGSQSLGIRKLVEKLKQIIRNATAAEFAAYRAVPKIETDKLLKYYHEGSSGFNSVYYYLEEHKQKHLVINNKFNPSTFEFYDLSLSQLSDEKATFESVEYWYLLWYDEQSASYPIREMYKVKNRQTYTLTCKAGCWKIDKVFFPEYDNV